MIFKLVLFKDFNSMLLSSLVNVCISVVVIDKRYLWSCLK